MGEPISFGPIPYGRQHINDEDIKAVTSVLTSDYLTQGPKVGEFEDNFSAYIGVDYSVAVSNGTAALHIAVLALGIRPGQKVITTPITFAASANCVLYAGGKVDFVDIDPETFLIDLDAVEARLNDAEPGEYTGIIPVDFTGMAVNMERLRNIADKYDVWILEDACHAPGGSFENSKGEVVKCGSGMYSDAAIFSFHPVKHIAAGEGGMVTTNDWEIAEKLKTLRTHGITKDPQRLKENHGGWYYEMQDLGYNYRMTDIQCALGLSQLRRADQGLKERRKIAARYDQAFDSVSEIERQKISEAEQKDHHAYHLYVIKTQKRKELYDHLRDHEIYSQIHYIPVHLQPYYKRLGWRKGDCLNAEEYYEHCISLPMYPTLSDSQQEFVIDKVLEVIGK